MRIIRYLKNCKIAVVLIVCLLVVQAFTDLALPNYTSQIVDVGIQQSGVEHAATDEMTAKTHDEIAMMLPENDEQTFRDAYTESDSGTYTLNDQGKKEQEELDRMVAMPLVAIHYASQIPDLDLDQVMQAYQAGAVQKRDVLRRSAGHRRRQGRVRVARLQPVRPADEVPHPHRPHDARPRRARHGGRGARGLHRLAHGREGGRHAAR